eukprot:5787144-Ditylum_brightwellii.AAC.1
MNTAPTSMRSNPNIKRAVIAFQQPQARQLERRQYHMYKLRTTPADTTSPIYKLSVPFLTTELQKSGSSPGAGYRQCSRDTTSCRDPQATQLPRPFSKATC